MPYNFDEIIERRTINSEKWMHHPEDVLPMWVADMDFRSPEPVLRALHERIDNGTFGYEMDSPQLREVIVERMQRLYNWSITPDCIVFLSGLVTGLNLVCQTVGKPGDGVLMTTPVYGPFLMAPPHQSHFTSTVELAAVKRDDTLHYEIDFDALEGAITPQTSLFLLCNPHNPVGRVYRRDELERLAEICLKHNITLCSDEIHCDLLFDGNKHIPTASLSPEIGARTITLMAASKTYNVPGLSTGFAIVPNPELRDQLRRQSFGAGHNPGLGLTATLAAYRDSQEWLDALLVYLQANRDVVRDYVRQNLPGVTMTHVEGTYLAWLDFRESGVPQNPAEFCLNEAKVAFNDGAWFGHGGEGFVRLNFGTPRAMLTEGLERVKIALEKIQSA